MTKPRKGLLRTVGALAVSLAGLSLKPASAAAFDCPTTTQCMDYCPVNSICATCPPGINQQCDEAIYGSTPCAQGQYWVYCAYAT